VRGYTLVVRAGHLPGWLLAVVIGASAAGCSRAEPAADPEASVGVTVQAVRRASMRDAATASGLVVPSAAGEWTIYAPAAARIVRLPVKENDTVAAGDVLVQFEVESITQELNARQAEVTEAAARADRARAEFVRMDELFQRGIAARNAYEAARTEQTTATSILAQAVSLLEAIKLQSAQSTIRARFAGVVAKVAHQEGEFVSGSPTDPILQVIDPSRLQVAAQFPIPQLARIVQGQAATILAIGGDGPLEATVASKPSTVDANAPTGEVRLAFVGASTLAANAPVSVEILLDQRTNALVVPTAAVLRDDLSAYVMLVGDDGRAHRRDVRTGLVTDTLAEVLSGLEPEMRVIVAGVRDVSEGTLVVFRE
jgi:RND family efflux transporter MFP subunit